MGVVAPRGAFVAAARMDESGICGRAILKLQKRQDVVLILRAWVLDSVYVYTWRLMAIRYGDLATISDP